MTNTKRIGRFFINLASIHEDEGTIKAVMAECVVVRAETMFCRDRIEYEAISSHFKEVPLGQCIPEYQVLIHQNEGEPIKVEFKPA